MHSWVTPNLLDDQIAAERYTPDQILNLKRLSELGAVPLGTLIDHSRSNYGVLPPSDQYVDASAGIGLVRGGDLDHGFVRQPNVFAPAEFATARGTLREDDVLILAKGACIDEPAGVGLVSKSSAGQTFNGTSYRARFTNANPAYVVAFCLTEAFLLQKHREISNTGVSYNSERAIKAFRIVTPSSDAQAYIGDKVRQSEALRREAQSNCNIAKTRIKGGATFELEPSFSSRPRRIDAADLSDVSLDPAFARATRGHRLIPGGLPLGALVRSCKCGDPIRADDRRRGSYPYYGASGPIDVHDAYNFDGEYLIVAQDGSIGCTNVARGRFWANNHVWVLALKPGYDLDAVALYLQDYYPYWSGATTGSVVPKVTSESLLRICLPMAVAKEEGVIGASWRRAVEQSDSAKRLTSAARLLVEALIAQKVAEAELVAAHKDPGADRALLARLTQDGIDTPDSLPLFPDLDRLEELLAEAQAGGAE